MTRFKRQYLLVCLLLLLFPGVIAIAQHKPDTLSVGMYPPEAASLMTYTDYPVSYMTGTPDISIPLYTIKSGTLELPLTLKFHMGDYLRANQAAGVIGAGWSLSTDFLVTRKIKGLDDLSTYGYLHTGHLLTEQEDLMNVTWKMAQEIIDGEPDRYYFRTLDGNGNFYVLENGTRIEQVPSGPEKIEFTTGLSVSSNPTLYSMIAPGDYKMSQQQMATSSYNKNSLNYRIKTLNGNLTLPATNGKDMTGVFMHRTNWDGKATSASSGCLVIDGRQWRSVEYQLRKSQNIYLRLKR